MNVYNAPAGKRRVVVAVNVKAAMRRVAMTYRRPLFDVGDDAKLTEYMDVRSMRSNENHSSISPSHERDTRR